MKVRADSPKHVDSVPVHFGIQTRMILPVLYLPIARHQRDDMFTLEHWRAIQAFNKPFGIFRPTFQSGLPKYYQD
jgi:hypothetical protein